METLDNNITSQENLRIGAEDKSNLNEMARWARFLAIIGFIGLGLMALVLIVMISFGATSPLMREASAPVGAMVAGFVIGITIYFFPIYYLFLAAKGIRSGLANNDDMALSEGFKNLKSHYKYIGILAVIILSIYALVFIIAMFAGLAAMG